MGIDLRLLLHCLLEGFVQGVGFSAAVLLIILCLKITGVFK